jgi:hypothetical protein
VALGSAGQATQSGIQVFGNMNVSASAGGGGNINATATITGNDVVASSDIRLKYNIVTVDSALQKVLHLRGVYFTKTGSEKRNVGVIAQEVEEVLPEVVHTDSEGMKSVAYGNIVGLLIEGMKQQQEQIDKLIELLDQ